MVGKLFRKGELSSVRLRRTDLRPWVYSQGPVFLRVPAAAGRNGSAELSSRTAA